MRKYILLTQILSLYNCCLKRLITPKYVFILFLFFSIFVTTYNSAHCETLSTKDFAYGIVINVSGDSPIYKVELPEAVYQGVLRQDLGDIRIFNGNGEIVPHLLRNGDFLANKEVFSSKYLSNIPSSEEILSSDNILIPFFPLYNEIKSSLKDDLSLIIIQNEDGTIIRVKSLKQPNQINDSALKDNNSVSEDYVINNKLRGYLLDMNKIKPYPIALNLEWNGGGDHFVINVELNGSNDLTHWYFITKNTLARLQFAGNSIYQNQILLNEKSQYKYIRLSWHSEGYNHTSNASLSKITAIFPKPSLKRKREWKDISNGIFSQTNKMVIDYDSGGFFPVGAVQIKFHQTNSIIKAEIQSSQDSNFVEQSNYAKGAKNNSNNKDNIWQYRCEGVFYTLSVKSSEKSDGLDEVIEISNDIFAFSTTSDRLWRLKVSQDGAGLSGDDRPPILKIGWIPHEILFVARGNPPYTLAYGSAKLLKKNIVSQAIPDIILQANNKTQIILQAKYGTPKILGGKDALKLEPPPLPWKKWILWGVLIAGVSILLFMTWRLVCQMRTKTDV